MALNPEQLAKLLKLRAIGWSQKEIADALDTSQQVVAYQLKKLKEQSMKSNADEVFQQALLAGLAVGGLATGGIALAMLLEQLTKK